MHRPKGEERDPAQDPPVVHRMKRQARRWEETGDLRQDFLRCYTLMTRNMLRAIEAGRFRDPAWVDRLLHHFAEYYFGALETYENGGEETPAVWTVAFQRTGSGELSVLQRLLLGINAHINYDLVLALRDLLDEEWAGLDASGRRFRYEDHCTVNEIIGETVDAVQDTVVEVDEPALNLIDLALGPLDEWIASGLIRVWRQEVWDNAMGILGTPDPLRREDLRRRVEAVALRRARLISGDVWADGSDERA